MTTGISPQKLDELANEVEKAARVAAGDSLRSLLPFEPTPDQAGSVQSVGVRFKNGYKANVSFDPASANPDAFGFAVTDPTGEPADIKAVPGMVDGKTTLSPEQVPPALKAVEKAAMQQITRFTDLTGGKSLSWSMS